ncbi:MAG TPA: ABC transporter substrate-binding protein [Chloroflexota bacterium]|nr:ABC transporter substrate-binding protein [Chloroflexota bacterium]
MKGSILWGPALAALLVGCGGQAAGPAPAGSSPAASSSAAPASAGKPAAPSAAAAKPAGGSASAAKPLTKLRFALPINSGLQVLPQVALDAGYFKDEGLDASITMIRGSQEVIAALTNGEIDMANSDSPSIINAHLSGANTEMLAVPVSKPIFELMVPASITKPEDLKGKTVAVSRICDSTCFQVSRALVGWGLKPQQDVKLLGVQDYTGMFSGLKSGQIAAAALAPPFNFQAKQEGFHSLVDMSKLPVDYPTAVVQTLKPFTDAHPDTTVAFLRAYVRAIQRYKSDEAFMVATYKKFLKSNDTQVIQDTWTFYRGLLHDDPTPTADGVKFVLDSLAAGGDKKAASANPNEFIAPQFMEKVKASGLMK